MVAAEMQERVRRLVRRALVPVLGLLLAAAVPGAAQAAEKTIQRMASRATADAALLDDDGNARVIVKYRAGSSLAQTRRGADRLGRRLALRLEDGHQLGTRSQSLRGRGISAQALAARLATDPDVEWAQPVGRKTVRAGLPNDPLFADNQTTATPAAGQWFLRAPDATLVSAVNAVGAWAITPGSATITVAVLDTGVRYDHPDLLAASQGGKLWPGYDFVSRSSNANDDGGQVLANSRDGDASDPGDWSTASDSCGASNSSWHGTQVAGLIGAATDNGIGVAGVGRDTMVLPVRVLGRCGGFDDDIIAGMRWAAGLSNLPVANVHPARVINLSLGSSGSCSPAYRDVIAELNAAGVVVVVASGNDTGHAVNEPANCPGALAVAGVRHAGTKVGYSNLGPQVAIAAPAGNCVNLNGLCLYPLVTTLNAGSTTPGASIYSSGSLRSLGTSFATPIVAASAALMLATNPSLTPSQIKAMVQATARPFPSIGAQENGTQACEAAGEFDQIECYCTTTTCGAGLLDIGAAVARAAGRTLDPLPVFQVSSDAPTAGMRVQLDGSPSGVGVVARSWTIVSGGERAGFEGATDASSAVLATRLPGTVVIRLTGTSATGQSVFVDKPIQVKAGPTAALRVNTNRSSVGAVLALDATASAVSPGRTVVSYAWTLSGQTPARFTSSTNASTATLATDVAGADVTVSITVIDSAGDRHVTSQTVSVSPGPVATISASSTTPGVGTAVRLDGSTSKASPGLSLATFQWSVVSGASFVQLTGAANASMATFNAMAPGTAVLRLTVTDSAGASASTDVSIAVTPSASGGGGALGVGWLLALAAAVLLLRRVAPRQPR